MCETHRCHKCHIDLTLKHFYKNPLTKSGLLNTCKFCLKEDYMTKGKLKKVIYNSIVYTSKKVKIDLGITREEFMHWINNSKEFNDLYHTWSTTGYKRNLRPCVDRIDPYGTYNKYNIKVETREQQDSTKGVYRKNGIGPNVKTRVKINGNIFPTIAAASRDLGMTYYAINNLMSGKKVKGYENYSVERA